MEEKNKDNMLDDYKKLKNEIIIDRGKIIFRSQPDNYIAALEEHGLEYHEKDDEEEIEKKRAKPENKNQRIIVAYFEGKQVLLFHPGLF